MRYDSRNIQFRCTNNRIPDSRKMVITERIRTFYQGSCVLNGYPFDCGFLITLDFFQFSFVHKIKDPVEM